MRRLTHSGSHTWTPGDAIPAWLCLGRHGFAYYQVGDPVNADPTLVTCPGCLEELARDVRSTINGTCINCDGTGLEPDPAKYDAYVGSRCSWCKGTGKRK